MQVKINQALCFDGTDYPLKHGKPVVYEMPDELKSHWYFKALQLDKKIEIVTGGQVVTEMKVEAIPEDPVAKAKAERKAKLKEIMPQPKVLDAPDMQTTAAKKGAKKA